jgi:hypothetical protein
VNDVSWGALALALTTLGGIYTWWALRHRGVTAAARAAGITLLPLAAWMTGLLQVFGTVTNAFVHFFTRLVFSPLVWLGVVLFVVAFVLIGASGAITRRTGGAAPAARGGRKPKQVGRTPATSGDSLIDDEMAEIQAILKKRGIS